MMQQGQQPEMTENPCWYRIKLKDGQELDIQARRVGWTPSGALAFHTVEDGAVVTEFLAAPGEWTTMKRLSDKKCNLHVFKAE
jgi:hypothetical protein